MAFHAILLLIRCRSDIESRRLNRQRLIIWQSFVHGTPGTLQGKCANRDRDQNARCWITLGKTLENGRSLDDRFIG